MAKRNYWQQIFRTDRKQEVRIGGKLEELTATQAYRLEELTGAKYLDTPSTSRGDMADACYSFAEASRQLRVSEKALFQAAATGSIDLFVNCAGLDGHWRRDSAHFNANEGSAQVLNTGYLALTAETCSELARFGMTDTSALEFRRCSDMLPINRDHNGPPDPPARKISDTRFCLSKPLVVDRNMIVLFSPLPTLPLMPMT